MITLLVILYLTYGVPSLPLGAGVGHLSGILTSLFGAGGVPSLGEPMVYPLPPFASLTVGVGAGLVYPLGRGGGSPKSLRVWREFEPPMVYPPHPPSRGGHPVRRGGYPPSDWWKYLVDFQYISLTP